MKKKFNHAVDVAFEVHSNNEDEPTPDECIQAMEKRLAYLKSNPDEAKEAFGSFDVHENI